MLSWLHDGSKVRQWVHRPSLDEYWIAMLPLVASRGTCPRRQVACILVDAGGKLVSTGYNGPAAGLPHCTDQMPCPGSPELHGAREDCEATHSELNAVLQSLGSRRAPVTAYCSLTPCRPCAQALIGAGIKDVVALTEWRHGTEGQQLLVKAGISIWLWTGTERSEWSAHK